MRCKGHIMPSKGGALSVFSSKKMKVYYQHFDPCWATDIKGSHNEASKKNFQKRMYKVNNIGQK